MSSNAETPGGLIEALASHVRELSAKIGERSVLRGNGLDRANTSERMNGDTDQRHSYFDRFSMRASPRVRSFARWYKARRECGGS